jgi:glutaredoxin
MKITLYSKAHCSLCDTAKAALEQLRRECAFDLEIVDITADSALLEKYQFDIPVLAINGTEAAKHFISLEKLRVLAARFK